MIETRARAIIIGGTVIFLYYTMVIKPINDLL